MLTDCLQKALDTEGIALDEFRELAIRLLNYGVLTCAEPNVGWVERSETHQTIPTESPAL